MSAFVNLIAVLALLLSFAPFGFLSAGGSNVLRYPITVDKPGIVEEASAIDASGANLEVVIDKRFDNARFTYYADGMGACGQWNSPGDFIVALNTPQWDNGAHCFTGITINAKPLSVNPPFHDSS